MQRAYYEENRRQFMALWDYVTAHGPSREEALALTALMWVDADVACNSVGIDEE